MYLKGKEVGEPSGSVITLSSFFSIFSRISVRYEFERPDSLAKANNDIPTSISFLSTHPLTTNRIKDAADFSKKHSYLSTSVSDNLQSLWNELHKE
jgi:hypothetical protein